MESASLDPDLWMTELESLRTEMDTVAISGKISGTDFIIHILSNLPEEYEGTVENFKGKLHNNPKGLSIETIQEKLNARFEHIDTSTNRPSKKRAFAAFKKQY